MNTGMLRYLNDTFEVLDVPVAKPEQRTYEMSMPCSLRGVQYETSSSDTRVGTLRPNHSQACMQNRWYLDYYLRLCLEIVHGNKKETCAA